MKTEGENNTPLAEEGILSYEWVNCIAFIENYPLESILTSLCNYVSVRAQRTHGLE